MAGYWKQEMDVSKVMLALHACMLALQCTCTHTHTCTASSSASCTPTQLRQKLNQQHVQMHLFSPLFSSMVHLQATNLEATDMCFYFID